jgi:methionine-rich copper-binding protein CopC
MISRRLRFMAASELSDPQIAVAGPDGSSVTTGQAKFDLAQPHNASVPTRDAGPGLYTVVWHNVSGEDGDSNDGSFVGLLAGASAWLFRPRTTTTITTGSRKPAGRRA